MVSSTYLSFVAALAATTSAAPLTARAFNSSADFYLQTVTTEAYHSGFNGFWIGGEHSGAGANVAIGVPGDLTEAATFYVQDDDTVIYLDGVYSSSGRVPYSVNLLNVEPYDSDAPPNYNLVDIDVGVHTKGFSINDDGIVEFGKMGFTTFALCYVNGTSPYVPDQSQYALLWRNDTAPSTPFSEQNCANVNLQAIQNLSP